MPGNANNLIRVAGIIVAAGKGARMETAEKKQFMVLGSRPVLSYALATFVECDVIDEIFLVVSIDDAGRCQREIINPLESSKPVHIVSGGATRQASVFNGLQATKGLFEFVVIHDGVRPLVTPEQITECVKTAEEHGACVLSLPVADTVKVVDINDRISGTVKRGCLRLAQTPQVFRYPTILEAHEAARKEGFEATDDAELVERLNGVVKAILGNQRNIKITNREDLKIARMFVTESS